MLIELRDDFLASLHVKGAIVGSFPRFLWVLNPKMYSGAGKTVLKLIEIDECFIVFQHFQFDLPKVLMIGLRKHLYNGVSNTIRWDRHIIQYRQSRSNVDDSYFVFDLSIIRYLLICFKIGIKECLHFLFWTSWMFSPLCRWSVVSEGNEKSIVVEFIEIFI